MWTLGRPLRFSVRPSCMTTVEPRRPTLLAAPAGSNFRGGPTMGVRATRRRAALLIAPLLFGLMVGCSGDTTGTSADTSPAAAPPPPSATAAAQTGGAVPQATICSDVDALQQS